MYLDYINIPLQRRREILLLRRDRYHPPPETCYAVYGIQRVYNLTPFNFSGLTTAKID